MKVRCQASGHRTRSGVTLAELLIAMLIGGVLMGGVILGYFHGMRQAEWSSYSLAANALALQRLEQTRSARWDPGASITNLISANFPPDVQVLDTTYGGTAVYATNYTTITTISTNPPLMMIRVDCVWRFMERSYISNSVARYGSPLYTNTIATYRAPDA